ncbi:MAG: hypothetical protein QOH14_799, partial [Pseudonocardiales bacterium]|nr:hypothetical protein [Pseudonocardiales bacterium]
MTTTLDRPVPPSDGSPPRETNPRPSLIARIRHSGRERGAFVALLVATALLYVLGLSKSGWANQFYAAAAQSGSKSWTAFLFGSLDSSNFITVDKPPASLWVMDASVRLFGMNSWTLLVPQALEGVAAVALLYAAVRRVAGPNAGLLAGAILATTPVATLMFRFDNPDALLVLLMTAAAYATVRATEHARGRWLVLAGALVGLAFLTKMLQGLLVLPAFYGAYLLAAPTSLRRRVTHVLASFAAMIAAAGWWIALVELWPAGSRPYIGGSNHNSILELTLGYNGIGRLTGSSNNGNVSGGAGGFSSGQTGLFRLFGTEMGTQISWLLPAALIALGALAWLTYRRPRTDGLRASVLVWGGWLLVTGLVLSFAGGIIHPYYTVALAPAIAALVGIAAVQLWRQRATDPARYLLAAVVGAGAAWSFVLLGRAPWHPELRWVVALSGAAAVGAVLTRRLRAVVAAPLVALALLTAPAAYALQTASTAHTGAIPTAGPGSSGFGAGRGGPGGGGGFGGGRANAGGTGGLPAAPGGTAGGPGGLPGSTGAGTAGGMRQRGVAQPGGLGGATTVGSALKAALTANAGSYKWVA